MSLKLETQKSAGFHSCQWEYEQTDDILVPSTCPQLPMVPVPEIDDALSKNIDIRDIGIKTSIEN